MNILNVLEFPGNNWNSRNRAYITFLWRREGLGSKAQWIVGKWPGRTSMVESNGEEQAILARIVCGPWCRLSTFGGERCSLFLVEERGFLHLLEIYDLLLGGKGEGRSPFLHLLLLNWLQLKIILMPAWHIWGGTFWSPSPWNKLSLSKQK